MCLFYNIYKLENRGKAHKPLTFFVLLIIISLSTSSTAALASQEDNFSSGGSIAPADLEEFIDQVMAQEMDRYHLPGAAIAVVQDEQILLAKGYGIADEDKGISVDAQKTIFPIASVTKLFTWTLVMQMVEQGKLDLKADINTYLVDDFQIPATYPQPITLLDLMAHTAGFEDNWIGTLAQTPDKVKSLRQYLIDHMPRRVRPPGLITGYSNYGVALAGYIAAKRCGSSYEECIRTYILEPLQMERTTVLHELSPQLLPDLASGYEYEDGKFRLVSPRYFSGYPAGSISSTASDMTHFMIAHLQNGLYANTRILQESTAQEMHRRSFTHFAELPGWAHGFEEREINGQRVIGHSGNLEGYSSYLGLAPELGLGLFIVCNSPEGSDALDNLVKEFFDRYYPSLITTKPSPPADFNTRASRFNGSYVPVRRSTTTLDKLRNLDSCDHLQATGDGALFFKHRAWVEVQPLVFTELVEEGQTGRGETLVFLVDDRGEIAYAAIGALDTWEKVGWYEDSAFQYPVIGFCFLLFLSAAIGWPVSAFIQRKSCELVQSLPLTPKLERWVAGFAAGLAAVSIIAFYVILSSDLLLYGVPPAARLVLFLPFIVIILTIVTMTMMVLVWKNNYWNTWGRVHYSLVALALSFYTWSVWFWNLVGFDIFG